MTGFPSVGVPEVVRLQIRDVHRPGLLSGVAAPKSVSETRQARTYNEWAIPPISEGNCKAS